MNQEQGKKNLKWYKRSIPLGLLLLIVFGVWGGYWIIIMITNIHIDPNTSIWAIRGQFGDMFGALNALFSGLAFAGIIYTIRQQKEELELQREELKMTREELAKSAEAQKKAEEALNKQVMVMNLTAKLNAHKSLLDYYYDKNKNTLDLTESSSSRQYVDTCVSSMLIILKELERQSH